MNKPEVIDEEFVENLSLKTERYFGDHLDMLWKLYHHPHSTGKLKSAAKKKYNEFAKEENRRLNRTVFKQI